MRPKIGLLSSAISSTLIYKAKEDMKLFDFTIVIISVIFVASCNKSEPLPYGYIDPLPKWAPGYVTNSGLCRDTTIEAFNDVLPQNWNGEVYNADIAYRMFLSTIDGGVHILHLDINQLEPIQINLVDNQYWVGSVSGSKKRFYKMMGATESGSFYIEIRKSDGMLLKLLLGE